MQKQPKQLIKANNRKQSKRRAGGGRGSTQYTAHRAHCTDTHSVVRLSADVAVHARGRGCVRVVELVPGLAVVLAPRPAPRALLYAQVARTFSAQAQARAAARRGGSVSVSASFSASISASISAASVSVYVLSSLVTIAAV